MPVRAQRRRSVRTTRAFSCARPTYSTPSSASNSAQILLGDVVLALVLGEADHLQPVLGDEALDAGDERLGLGCHRRGRSEALAQMAAQVPHDATDALQLRHVDVEVHPVDALAFEHDMVTQDFAHAVW